MHIVSMCILFCVSYTYGSALKSKPIYDFSKGCDTYHSSLSLPDGYVADSQNILFDDKAPITKRFGYTTAFTASKPFAYQSEWSYTDPSNTSWVIVRSSTQITASNLSGTQVLVATVSANNLVGETNSQGDAYFVDQTQGVYYWNGTATVYVSSSPLGSLITSFHGRIWVAGAAVPNGNQLYGSKYGDGTTWTIGLNPNDPVQLTAGLQDNFDGITALYPFLDTMYTFKHYSTYALYGYDQTSFQIGFITQECGCIDQQSIQTFNHGLNFVSERGVEFFDGYTCTRISDAIKDKIDNAIASQSGANVQSWVQSQTSDWNAGTIQPSGSLSTAVASPGLALSTMSATSFNDSLQANWQAGTLSGLDATSNVPNLQLTQQAGVGSPSNNGTNTGFASNDNAFCEQNPPCASWPPSPCTTSKPIAQAFITGAGLQYLTTIYIMGESGTGTPETYTVHLKADSSNSPGTDIATASITANGVLQFQPANFSNIPLSPSTRYWIYLDGGTTSATIFNWETTSNVYSPLWFNDSGCTGSIGFSGAYGIFSTNIVGGYISPGVITSRTFDTTVSTPSWIWQWNGFATSQTNNGQTIAYGTQSSANGSTWEPVQAASTSTAIASSVQRYVRYVATMTTTDISKTPVLSSVTINTTAFERSSGTLISQSHNIGNSSFGNFSVQSSLGGGSISYSVCTSPNANMSPAVCAAQTPNTQVAVATNTYVDWYATFTVTAQTQTPVLNSVTIGTFSGNLNPGMASTIYDNRYWLALSTNTADAFNDSIMVLNKNGAWAPFDIKAGGLTQFRNNLYLADALGTGNVYLYGKAFNDNGVPINAYFRSKDYSQDRLSSDDYYDSLYVSEDNSGNYNTGIQYFLDRDLASPFILSSVNQSEFAANGSIKIPFIQTNQNFGKCISMFFNESDLNSPWNFYGWEFFFHPRPVQ